MNIKYWIKEIRNRTLGKKDSFDELTGKYTRKDGDGHVNTSNDQTANLPTKKSDSVVPFYKLVFICLLLLTID
jgi:hypothetical protein